MELRPSGLFIRWKDGHESLYPYKYLRGACGCAGCVDELTHRRVLDPAKIPDGIQALDYMEVGRYAYQFLWSDAHFTGIYAFDYLRKLCPCSECSR
ncbi:MAG: DUF971 domain-containing protein [Chloroflexi bacterium]|nr:DUF971 domain-containing protein [Chloroflexota bacterium]